MSACIFTQWPLQPARFVAEELHQVVAPLHRIIITELDQRAAVFLLEQQVAHQVGAAFLQSAEGEQQRADGARQRVDVADRDFLERNAGRDQAEIDLAQRQLALLQQLARHDAQRAVDTLQPLEVDLETVEKNAVQAAVSYTHLTLPTN